MDAIGLMVTGITDGFLRVAQVGAWTHASYLGSS